MKSGYHGHHCPVCKQHSACAQITHCIKPDTTPCAKCVEREPANKLAEGLIVTETGDLKLSPEGAWALGLLAGAWRGWKERHDYNSSKLQCCERSRALFAALERFGQMILGKGEKKDGGV